MTRMKETNDGPTPREGSYWRAFLALYGAGLVGVLSLYPTLRPVAEGVLGAPGAPPLPVHVLQGLLLINPAILLLLGVAVGTALAPRLGLRSHVAATVGGRPPEGGPPLRSEISTALAWGIAAALAILVLDAAIRPFLGAGGDALRALEEVQPRTLATTAAGMLYGGIAEELMVRWGLMTLLAWLLWRILQRGGGRPGAAVMWTAIVAAALLFGAGHLGVVGAQVGLTTALVVRTVALNALGGIVFGWLFWRKSLEAAMIAHAASHVVFTLAAWAGRLFAGV